MMHEPVNSYNL